LGKDKRFIEKEDRENYSPAASHQTPQQPGIYTQVISEHLEDNK